jgi:hypothetical protein
MALAGRGLSESRVAEAVMLGHSCLYDICTTGFRADARRVYEGGQEACLANCGEGVSIEYSRVEG